MIAVHNFAHFATQLALIAGVVTSLGVLSWASRKIWTVMRKVGKWFEWVEDIWENFQPNGGGSVKETISRIDRNVQTNARNIQTVYSMILKMHDLDSYAEKVPLLEPSEVKEEAE